MGRMGLLLVAGLGCAGVGGAGMGCTDGDVPDAFGLARTPILNGSAGSLDAVGLLLIDYDPATDLAADACGATLVAERTLLTAGHCVDGRDLGGLRARYGSTLFAVASTVSHDGRVPDSYEQDIALVVLAERPPVAPMALSNREPRPDMAVQLYGYGISTIGDGTTAGTLRRGEKTIAEVGWNYFEVRGADDNSADGDSGGPIVVDGDVIGVISASTADFERSFHVRVDTFAFWLDEHATEPLLRAGGPEPRRDAGTTPPDAPGGCNTAASRAPAAPAVLLLAAALVLRRRTRRPTPTTTPRGRRAPLDQTSGPLGDANRSF